MGSWLQGTLVFYIPIMAVFSFLGVLGAAWGVGDGAVANVVSIGLLAGFSGSFTAGLIGNRMKPLWGIMIGVTGVRGARHSQ